MQSPSSMKKAFKKEIKTLKAVLQEANESAQYFEEKASSIVEALETTDKENKVMMEVQVKLQKELTKTQESMAKLKEAHAYQLVSFERKAKAEMEAALAEAKQVQENLAQQLEKKKSEVNHLRLTTIQLELAFMDQNASLENTKSELKAFKKLAEETDAVRKELVEIKQKMEEFKKDADDSAMNFFNVNIKLFKTLIDSEDKIEKMDTNIKSKDEELAQAKICSDNLAQLLELSNKELAEVQEAMKEQTNELEELKVETDGQVEFWFKKNLENNWRVLGAEDKIEELNRAIEADKAELANAHGIIRDQASDLEAAKAELAKELAQSKQLAKVKADSLARALGATKSKLSRAQGTIEDQDKELEVAKDELAKARQGKDQATQIAQDQEAKIANLKEELRQLSKSHEEDVLFRQELAEDYIEKIRELGVELSRAKVSRDHAPKLPSSDQAEKIKELEAQLEARRLAELENKAQMRKDAALLEELKYEIQKTRAEYHRIELKSIAVTDQKNKEIEELKRTLSLVPSRKRLIAEEEENAEGKKKKKRK